MDHYLRHDYRIGPVKTIILALEGTISDYKSFALEVGFDGITLLEDTEPILGIAFVTLQNYINSSIYDLDGNLARKEVLYKVGKGITSSKKTQIELIIGLANYFKHRDDNRSIHRGTRNILDSFGIDYSEDLDITRSPILQGMDTLDENWSLLKLIDIVEEWRETIWVKFRDTPQN